MTIVIIIIAYVANVFLNRWLNKILNKYWDFSIEPYTWFLSVICTFIQIVAILHDAINLKERANWFTGKHWK